MNGTTSTERKQRSRKIVLNSNDVCNIIKECANTGVSELKFGDLHLKFGYTLPAQPQAPLGAEIPEAQLKQEENEYLDQEFYKSKDDEIENMIIEDPSKFEELLNNGEFDGEESGGSTISDEEPQAWATGSRAIIFWCGVDRQRTFCWDAV